MFDIKCQPELHLVDVWYQMSTRTLSGWCLISIISRVATGSWLIFIYSRYRFSLHFRVCRFKKRIQFWHFFWLDFVIFACMKNDSWSNINQNCAWLMFDIKCQPELHLVDVWYQMSTRTLSGWCLILIINRLAIGSWLIFIYSRYVFSLHFRVCRFQKRYTILALSWLDFVIFACLKNDSSSNINQNCTWLMFDIKRQPKLYLVDVWYQMSTRTASGWCLTSNVNQNSIWLMFNINHQSGGYWFMIDIHIL